MDGKGMGAEESDGIGEPGAIGIAGGPGQDFGKRSGCEFIRSAENVERAIETENADHADFLGRIGDL